MNLAVAELYVFILAGFVGYQVITRVPPLLHTPLMSATNAIHGIVIVGAILVAGVAEPRLGPVFSLVVVILATINVMGGFVVTERMLQMFKPRQKPSDGKSKEGGK